MRQAILAASVCEFLGAVLVGAKVAGTIKNSIISISVFRGNAPVAMLSFTCALVASATWLMIATKNSWPVSTTYSLVSALAGVGVAVGGIDAPNWGWNGGKGLATIFAGMVIAPALAGAFGAIVYLITKYAVLERKNSVKAAMIMSPIYFFTVAAVLTMSIGTCCTPPLFCSSQSVYKGAPSLNLADLPEVTVALAIVLTALVVAVLSLLFWLPYVYAKVVKKDYTIRWFHFFHGPLLWRRPAPEISMEHAVVPDYRNYGRDEVAPQSTELTPSGSLSGDVEAKGDRENAPITDDPTPRHPAPLEAVETKEDAHPIIGEWYEPKNIWIFFRYKILAGLLYGSNIDIHEMQAGIQGSEESARIAAMHQQAHQYGNETEHLYSFLQVMTACTNSFAHGANDVANAIGPLAAVYYIWQTGTFGRNTPTETWTLVFGGAFIVIGLATYGYKIMGAIGNRLTLMSPSRGFSMELGSSITVLLASQYALPVSTTMCIMGATTGVGLVSSGWRAVNWRALGWIFFGWVLTVPIAAVTAGCLMGIILNAPRF
jgi:sodium-dependent phosphate transporter